MDGVDNYGAAGACMVIELGQVLEVKCVDHEQATTGAAQMVKSVGLQVALHWGNFDGWTIDAKQL